MAPTFLISDVMARSSKIAEQLSDQVYAKKTFALHSPCRETEILFYGGGGSKESPMLITVNGHEIALYDPAVSGGDQGYIRLKDAHGNVVELSNARISIRSKGSIDIEAPNVTINGRPVAPQPRPI